MLVCSELYLIEPFLVLVVVEATYLVAPEDCLIMLSLSSFAWLWLYTLQHIRPCHTIPGGPSNPKIVETVDAHHPRIESAYRKYFYRAPAPPKDDDGDEENSAEKHEFEIIVCHANVIRYWMCRYVLGTLHRLLVPFCCFTFVWRRGVLL